MFTRRIALVCAALATTVVIGGSAIAQTASADSGAKVGRKARGARAAKAETVNYAPLLTLPADTIDKLVGGFTADQKTKITDILVKYKTAADALKPAKGQPADPEARKKRAEYAKEAVEAIGAVVTPAQKDKLTEAAKTAAIYKFLGLPLEAIAELKPTADQQTKGAEIVKAAQDEIKTLPAADRRTKGKEIAKAAHDKVMDILTPEQKAIIEKYTDVKAKKGGKKSKK